VDAIGLIITAAVMAASAHENAMGAALLSKVAASTGTVSKPLVDRGFKKSVVEHGAAVEIEVQNVARDLARRGFIPQPIRWRVEQAFGTLMLHRRLVRDYESNPRTSESRVYRAISANTLRHLTGTQTPTWRGA
jgi:hypothetical protein